MSKSQKWTKSQETAINAEGCSLIISAGAGSGKTAVLVERLLRIISDEERKTPADSLIVATFTNDAAFEMKQRLNKAINERIKENPGNSWLRKQQISLKNAEFSTISSFCFSIIRENSHRLGLSQDFRIMEENERNILVVEVINQELKKSYIDHLDDTKFLVDCFCTKNDQKLEEILFELYKFSLNIPFFDSKDWNKIDDEYDFLQEFKGIIAEKIKIAQNQAELASEYAGDFQSETKKDLGKNTLLPIIESDIKIISDLRENFLENRFSEKVIWDKLVRNTPEIVQKLRKLYKKTVEEVIELLPVIDNYEDDRVVYRRVTSILSKMVINIRGSVLKEKLALNAFYFDDGEYLALNLLTEISENGQISKSPICSEMSKKYKYICIDEFQDANDYQEIIFNLLSENGDFDKRGENLFTVGDIKQSIYGFRGSNPTIFSKVLDNSVEYNENSQSKNRIIRLNNNFRSPPEILNFVNFVFSHIMSENLGGVEYTEKEYLVSGLENQDNCNKVEFISYEDNEKEAVSGKIKQLLDDKFQITDKKGNKRACEPRDICILTRVEEGVSDSYVSALTDLGIPVKGKSENAFLESKEITILVNILKIIDNPLQDLEFLSVAMSPMFMFSAEDIAILRLIKPNFPLYSALCEGIETENINSLTLSKFRNMHQLITEFRQFSATSTLNDLILEIYERTDFQSVIQLYVDSDKKRANLRLLLYFAGRYEENGNNSLTGFLRYISKIIENKGDFKEGKELVSSSNSVRILSIHKSKGLEFPIVFLVGSEKNFNFRGLSNSYLFDVDLGFGYYLKDRKKSIKYKTAPHYVIKNKMKKSQLSEEMRLLYVALTRPREKLFVSLGSSDEVKTPENAQNFGDWFRYCIDNSKQNSEIYKFTSAEITEIQEITKPTSKTEKSKYDHNIYSLISKRINTKYDNKCTETPIRVSVSEIKLENNSKEILLKPPKISQKKELSPTEKGTALHTFMRFANLKNAENDINSEILRLVNNQTITEKEGKSICTINFSSFFESNLYKNILNCKNCEFERPFLVDIESLNDPSGLINQKYQESYLAGIIDLILEDEDGLTVVDYKTDFVKNAQELVDRYQTQLILYMEALRVLQDKPVKKAIIYSFSLSEEIHLR